MYIRDLIVTYKYVRKMSKNQDQNLFYKNLREQIILDLKGKKEKEDILKSYKLSCCAFIECDFIGFNMATVAIVLSLLGLVDFASRNAIYLIGLLVIDLTIGIVGVRQQMTKCKIIDLSKVLDTIDDKDLFN